MKEGVVRNAYLQITEGRNGVRRMTIIRLKKEWCEFVKYSATKDKRGHIFHEYGMLGTNAIPILHTSYSKILKIKRMVFFSKVAARAQGSI